MLLFVYLAVVAATTAVMGVVILLRRVSLFIRGVRATGALSRWESRGGRRIYYHPVVRFVADDGKQYEFVGDAGSTEKKARDIYRVVYLPGAPGQAMVLSFWGFWAAPPAFFILSAGAAIAAYQQYPK